MRIRRRACLYIRRGHRKSLLLFLVMLFLFSFVMIGMLLSHATDVNLRLTRESIGGGFRIAPDIRNRYNIVVSTEDGQTSIAYVGEPLDENRIQAILAKSDICAYNAVFRGNGLLQEDLRLIDYSGKYREDTAASHLVSVEAHTNPLLSVSFQRGQLKLSDGGTDNPTGENMALISEELALQNHLQIGDEIQLFPREDGLGKSVSVKINGFFRVEAAQQNTDIAAPVDLLENKIFLQPGSGAALLGTTGADYVDFFVNDPARVWEIIEEIRNTECIDWNCFSVTANIDEYQQAAGPLESMKRLADTLLAILGAVSIAVLSLMQTLFQKSRQQETGILLAMGISKTEILLQHFLETAFLAAPAFALAVCVSLTAWPHMTALDTASPADLTSIAALAAISAGCGIFVLFLSTVFSNIGVMSLSPREILSRLS